MTMKAEILCVLFILFISSECPIQFLEHGGCSVNICWIMNEIMYIYNKVNILINIFVYIGRTLCSILFSELCGYMATQIILHPYLKAFICHSVRYCAKAKRKGKMGQRNMGTTDKHFKIHLTESSHYGTAG